MNEHERVLFVHAHPDDESIATGATIATLVDSGALVTVVTCTRGERGEVIPPELQHLLDSPDALASHREGELRAALQVLGVTDHRFLGGTGARWPGRQERRYLDSGMAWGAGGAEQLPGESPGSLTAAEFGEVAADIAAVIVHVQPHVVVSYDERGGYGHPDHVRAHEAARRAADVYDTPFFAISAADASPAPSVVVDVQPVLDRKRQALAAHRTQLLVEGDDFLLSNGSRHSIGGVEAYRRIHHRHQPVITPFGQQHWVVKAVAAALAAVVGLSVGTLLTVAHQASVHAFGMTIPLGIIAGIALLAALLVGMRLVFATRFVAGFTAAGILAAVSLLSLESSGGSILVPANEAGYVWTFGPAMIALLVLAWPNLPQRPRDRMGKSSK